MPPPIELTDIAWPLVVVGAGTAAAYYVSTVDLHEYPSVLAIGDGDAWAGPRGYHGDAKDPTRRLNHPLHLIAHFKKTVPGFSQEMVDRMEWANMNRAVLDECRVQVHSATVKKVSEGPLPPKFQSEGVLVPVTGYRIDLEDDKKTQVYAYKVVMAAGAGGHRVPTEVKGLKELRDKLRDPVQSPGRAWQDWKVFDIDEFAHLGPAELGPSKTVFVLGPNAAIDAVQKALHYQCKVIWLIEGDKQPAVLATQPTVSEALKRKPSIIHRYTKDAPLIVSPHLVAARVQVRAGGKNLEGDYFVYGLGQTGEPVKKIDALIMQKLKPIVDKNNYLGEGESTVLGFEAEGTGLKRGFEVVGAMSAQVGRVYAKEDNLDRLKKLIGEARLVKTVYTAITTAGFPVEKPFLLKDPDFLARQPRKPLRNQLQREADFVAQQFRSQEEVGKGVQAIVNLLLNYHSAKNYKPDQLNQATAHLPKGTVADGGQAATIRSAMAAKHDFVPSYVGSQEYQTPGPRPKGHPDRGKEVEFNTVAGEVDFNGDNWTVIQIGLCLRYPFISDTDLNNWVEQKMLARRASGVGFNDAQVKGFYTELERMNKEAMKALCT
jgi:hypothetical protein